MHQAPLHVFLARDRLQLFLLLTVLADRRPLVLIHRYSFGIFSAEETLVDLLAVVVWPRGVTVGHPWLLLGCLVARDRLLFDSSGLGAVRIDRSARVHP